MRILGLKRRLMQLIHKKMRHGFTLLELLIVIGILAVLVGVVFANIGGIMKKAIQLLYRLKRSLLSISGLKTRGAKVMVFNRRGELLLTRNSYGKTHLHVLPGGGIGLFETPAAAARREVREEVDVSLDRLDVFAIYQSRAEGKRDTVHLFTAFTEDSPKADSFEIEEASFFPLDSLPETTSPATLRRIREYRGERAVSEGW